MPDTGVPEPLDPPAGFAWQTSPLAGRLWSDQYRTVTTDLDAREFKTVGGVTYWVDRTSGLDSNTGTESSPFKTIKKAHDQVGVGTIMVKAGLYERAVQFNSSSITKSVNIIGHGGTPVISNHDLASWTLTSGYTNTYQTARSAVGNVGDFIKGQPGIRYEEKQSVAEVEVTPGSYFPGASTVYVHTADGRPADGNIYPFIAGGGPIRMTGAHTLYLENLTILGGQSTVDVRCDVGGSGPVLAMRNINAGYSTVSNVINVLGASLVIAQNCDAFHGKYDGFNYHMSQGVVPKVVELNCRGFKNGGSSTSDNGSTAHDGVKVIRVNGRYWANHGPNVADVNTATQSWNLNTDAYDSRLDDDWVAGVGAEMWLDNCVATRSYRSANAGGTIRLRGCRLDRTIGNIEAY